MSGERQLFHLLRCTSLTVFASHLLDRWPINKGKSGEQVMPTHKQDVTLQVTSVNRKAHLHTEIYKTQKWESHKCRNVIFSLCKWSLNSFQQGWKFIGSTLRYSYIQSKQYRVHFQKELPCFQPGHMLQWAPESFSDREPHVHLRYIQGQYVCPLCICSIFFTSLFRTLITVYVISKISVFQPNKYLYFGLFDWLPNPKSHVM